MPKNNGIRTYYQLSLPAEVSEKLDAMSEKRLTPKAQLIKTAILAFIDHEHHDQPTCANGTKCLCPMMWQRSIKTPTLER